MLKIAILVTLVVFLGCCAWLSYACIRGNRTYDWEKVPATVIEIDVKRAGRNDTPRGWATRVQYAAAGQQHEVVLNEYFAKKNVSIYVNPKTRAKWSHSRDP